MAWEPVLVPGALFGGVWPRMEAGDLLLAVPLLTDPRLRSWSGLGCVALAMLVFGLISGFARCVADPDVAGWRACVAPLGALTLGLLGGLAGLGAGFAVLAVAFLAIQICRALGSRWSAAVAVLMATLAVVLRIDAGTVALGAAPGPNLLLLAGVFGLFCAMCRHRERLLRGSAYRARWTLELARRYTDVAIAALLCGLIVAYVLVLSRDPVIRAMAGAWAYLSAPFVLGGLLRYWHLAVVEERSLVDRGGHPFADGWLAAGVLGCAAALGLAPYL